MNVLKSRGAIVLLGAGGARAGRDWEVKCEPHIMIRMKRIFAKIERGQHGTILLSDTQENARDLLWFLDRYPMDLDDEASAYLARRSQEFIDRQMAIEIVLGSDYLPRRFELAIPLREYQAVATDLLLRTGELLIADDVGIGKTAIAIASFSEPATLPALVVTLTHLPPQWRDEIKKFAPSLRVHILKRATPYVLPPADVIISNYHKLGGWADTLAPVVRSVVYDEGQELRTGNGWKYRAAQHLGTTVKFRSALTATPIYNYADEIYHLLDVVAPGRLGTKTEFASEWCRNGRFESKAALTSSSAFGKYLREEGLMLRRTRRDVGRELPEVSKIPHHIDADPDALNSVATTAIQLARLILDINPAARQERFEASGELSYLLRQATGIGKAPFVAAFVRLLVESGERVVLYGWHHSVYDIWREALADFKPAFYTGQETVSHKEEAKRRFVEGETPILIMSLRAGAGLDGLQGKCRTVVFGELDWSPGVHLQAIGRIHRDGQKERVMAYFLVSDQGSDPVVVDVLGIKKEISEGIRDPDGQRLEELTIDPDHVRKLAEAYLEQRGVSHGGVRGSHGGGGELLQRSRDADAGADRSSDLADRAADQPVQLVLDGGELSGAPRRR